MRYLDSSVLVSSLIPDDPDYAACDRLLLESGNWTSPHALNEVFATLTGGRLGIRIDADVAVRMILTGKMGKSIAGYWGLQARHLRLSA